MCGKVKMWHFPSSNFYENDNENFPFLLSIAICVCENEWWTYKRGVSKIWFFFPPRRARNYVSTVFSTCFSYSNINVRLICGQSRVITITEATWDRFFCVTIAGFSLYDTWQIACGNHAGRDLFFPSSLLFFFCQYYEYSYSIEIIEYSNL